MSIMDKGIGIAMKTEDGAYRALDCVVPDLLHKHGYIDEIELKAIKSRLNLHIKNHRGQIVGEMRTVI